MNKKIKNFLKAIKLRNLFLFMKVLKHQNFNFLFCPYFPRATFFNFETFLILIFTIFCVILRLSFHYQLRMTFFFISN